MTFVHGHARAAGWVVSHRRAPNHAEEGQLPLLPAPEQLAELIPRQRSAEVRVRSVRKRAIT